MIEQVLEPFFTTKPVGKGTGLGLSMVYGFAQAIRRRDPPDQRTGQGNARRDLAPRGVRRGPAAPRRGRAGARRRSRRLNILLVDDHEGVRATTAAMLQDLGHKVSDVGEGAAALDMVRKRPDAFDLVLSDYAMPRLSGTDLVQRLREIRPALPAVIITGYAEPNLRPGGDVIPVLIKPFTPGQLEAMLEEAGRAAGAH
jgi:CheY-like chemotaxis protein